MTLKHLPSPVSISKVTEETGECPDTEEKKESKCIKCLSESRDQNPTTHPEFQ